MSNLACGQSAPGCVLMEGQDRAFCLSSVNTRRRRQTPENTRESHHFSFKEHVIRVKLVICFDKVFFVSSPVGKKTAFRCTKLFKLLIKSVDAEFNQCYSSDRITLFCQRAKNLSLIDSEAAQSPVLEAKNPH